MGDSIIISGDTGPASLSDIEGNLASMVELAQANHIRVVLSSVMPVCDYIKPQTVRHPPEQIMALKEWIQEFSTKNNLIYLDYYSGMLDDHKMLKQELTFKEHAQDGRGVTPAAERASEFFSHLAASSRALCAFREHAQDGRGVTLAAERASEFFSHLAASSRALCAFGGLHPNEAGYHVMSRLAAAALAKAFSH